MKSIKYMSVFYLLLGTISVFGMEKEDKPENESPISSPMMAAAFKDLGIGSPATTAQALPSPAATSTGLPTPIVPDVPVRSFKRVRLPQFNECYDREVAFGTDDDSLSDDDSSSNEGQEHITKKKKIVAKQAKDKNRLSFEKKWYAAVRENAYALFPKKPTQIEAPNSNQNN